MKIYLSGLHSGTNPQPGVGIARSLRAGYPHAEIIGVEYSNRSSGIHWSDFDKILLQRPWAELDLSAYAERVREILADEAWWISGSDLESLWLSDVFPDGHPRLLTPPTVALQKTAKPGIVAAAGLPVKIPTFITTELSDWDIHAFCRQNDWRVWLKGPYYEAIKINNWTAFETYRNVLTRGWTTEKLFLQTHVSGYEQSICFCAYRGELLDCVWMHKRDLTEENKTWAGETSAVPVNFKIALEKMVRDINYTGGAELEMVCDAGGQLWLLELNPRFPAWIHGATLTGCNLPARLVAGASGTAFEKPSASLGNQFSRVIIEVPVREGFPLAPLPEPLPAALGHSLKHPAGLTALAEKLHKQHNNQEKSLPNGKTADLNVPPTFIADLNKFDFADIATPAPLFLETTANAIFVRAAQLAAQVSIADVKVFNAYSLKTNPDKRLLRLALKHNFLAESISPLEIKKALSNNFKPEQTVLNGPGKWWRQEALPKSPLHAVFADSIADLERTLVALDSNQLQTNTLGVRLRTANIPSRFGIPVDSPDAFETLVQAVQKLPPRISFGVHFHFASSVVGVNQWWHLFESMLRWCRSLENLSNRQIELLDIGGGWFPDDLNARFADDFAGAVYRSKQLLPSLREIITEPGKAVAQPTTAVAMRLLEISGDGAVVDGSIAELPMYFFYPHRIIWQSAQTGERRQLGRGKTPLYGRLCMEHDIVAAGVGLPGEAQAGDVLIFFDAGGYDQSMSYAFGQG